jgi:phosphoglucosamine mutase
MKYFGTDGIRDAVGGALLAPGCVRRVGQAVGLWLRRQHGGAPLHVIIGRDTRASGPAIVYALAEGLAAQGVRAFDAGIVPTPAVALAVRQLDLPLGVVVTASHNPASDNGIKFFAAGGVKLTLAQEAELEDLIETCGEPRPQLLPPPVMLFDARRHYLEFIRSTLPDGWRVPRRIAFDGANGAAARTTTSILGEYGASVHAIGVEPDGANINAGVGSEHTAALAAAVRASGAELGIAHDGDGDRVILVDADGAVLDGDAVLAIIACDWLDKGELDGGVLVTTVMSNAGLEEALRQRGGRLLRADVGDRNVWEMMVASGAVLGGEASGHFIARRHLPTGDGLLAALLVLRIMGETGASLAELRGVYKPWPQARRDLPVRRKAPLAELPGLQAAMQRIEAGLPPGGRILVRYSGTEPKIRLLVEAPAAEVADQALAELCAAVHKELGDGR